MFKKSNLFTGLKLGHHSVKFAVSDGSQKNLCALKDYLVVPHELDLSLPSLSESGIHDSRQLVNLLKTSAEKLKIQGSKTALIVPDDYVVSRIISLKGPLDPESTREKLRTKLQTILPIALDKFNLTYQVVGEFNKKFMVLTELFLEKHCLELEKILIRSGLDPVLVDNSTFSAQSLFSDYLDSPSARNRNIALLNLGYASFSILLFRNGELRVNINKNIGTGSFLEEISRKKQLTVKNAAAILEEETCFLPEVSDEQDKIENYIAVRDTVSDLIRHIFAFFEFYLDRFHETRIDEIIITGGGANLKNFPDFLQTRLNIPVRPGSDLTDLTMSGKQLPIQDKNVLAPAAAALSRICSFQKLH